MIAVLTLASALATKPTPFDHQYKAWSAFLSKTVTLTGAASTVDYKKSKGMEAELNSLLEKFSAVPMAQYESWNKEQRMAFLINAYNAFTVQLIVKHYPLKSIKDIGSFFKSTWKREFFTLLGKKRHLDWVEHEMLRKHFNEARIHFAVNCASIGCPALQPKAFTPKRLDRQLHEATKLFLADATRNTYDAKKNEFKVSKIFDWFEKDFVKASGSVQKFVARYFSDDPAMRTKMASAEVDHFDYDWNLNEPKKP